MAGTVKRFPDLAAAAAAADTDLLALKQTVANPDAEPVKWTLAATWTWISAKIAANAAAIRTALGLGTMSTQAASAVAITGGTIAGVTSIQVAADGAVATPSIDVNGGGVYHTTGTPNIISLTPDKVAHLDVAAGGVSGGVTYGVTGSGNRNSSTFLSDDLTSLSINSNNATAIMAPIWTSVRGRGTQASPAVVVQNDYLLEMNIAGYDGAAARQGCKYRYIQIDATPSASAFGTRMTMLLVPVGSGSLSEIFRLDHTDGMQMFGANPVIDQNRIFRPRSYTVGTLPTVPATGIVFASNLGGGGGNVHSDGTNWCRSANGAPRVLSSNAAFTCTPLTDSQEVQHTGTLTANRAVTLSTTNAWPGAKFRITRTGGGAFTLDVGTGPLKSLATNTWGEFVYDGTAWYLAAYGAL